MNAFVWPLRVYYEDTDAGGVVYHAAYLKFFERARTEWLRALGYEQDRLAVDPGIVFVVRSLQIDYRRAARFNALLAVRTHIAERRGASLVFEQSLTDPQDPQQVYARAAVRVACVDAGNFRPRPLPDSLVSEMVCER